MKVIEPGTGQKGWSGKFRCTGKGNGDGGCGALLFVEQNDLYETRRGYMDGSTDYYTTFTCSECGVETDVNIPSNITVRKSRNAPPLDL